MALLEKEKKARLPYVGATLLPFVQMLACAELFRLHRKISL